MEPLEGTKSTVAMAITGKKSSYGTTSIKNRKNSPERASNKTSERMTKKSYETMNKKPPQKAAKKSTEEVTKKSFDKMPKKSSNGATISEDATKKSSNVVSKKTSKVATMKSSETLPKRSSKGTAENLQKLNTHTGLILGLLIVLAVALWYGFQNGRVKAFLMPAPHRFDESESSSANDDTSVRHQEHERLPFDAEPYDSTNPAE